MWDHQEICAGLDEVGQAASSAAPCPAVVGFSPSVHGKLGVGKVNGVDYQHIGADTQSLWLQVTQDDLFLVTFESSTEKQMGLMDYALSGFISDFLANVPGNCAVGLTPFGCKTSGPETKSHPLLAFLRLNPQVITAELTQISPDGLL